MLMKKARLLITALMLFAAALYAGAQNISVSGTVIDSSNGEPVIGATVQLKGSATKYSITNLDGQYALSAVPSNGTLVVTLIGYKAAEFPIEGRTKIDLPLAVDSEVLEDAIVVGYGSAKKISAITGSAATVGAKLLQNAPVASVGDALQGQVAGLQVWSNSGEPSATISMRIRGVNSISADTEPLFILDGSPVPASIFTALNANDIENITVMKDASATSIYGSRAANGVVFITTKAGRSSEKPVFTVRAQYGFSNIVNHNIQLMTSEQWFDFNEMMDPTFLDKPGNAANKDFALDHNINTNWVDYFFKPHAPTWQADATYSGGTSKTDYYVSLGALSQEGNAPYSDMTRVSLMTKLNTQLNDWLKTGFSMNLTYQDVNTTGFSSKRNSWYNPMFAASQMLPWMLPYEYTVNEDGSLTLGKERDYFDEMGFYNTYYLQKIQPSTTNYIRLSGNLYEQLTPIKGLTLRAVQALNGNDRRISQKANPVGPFEGAGTAGESFSRYYQITFTNTAEYTFDFAEKNNINILLGQEAIISDTNAFGTSVEGITDMRQEQISDGTTYKKPTWSKSEEVFNSYFSRVGFNHDDKYLVDASFRRDGSSLFGKNKRYANFWSLGARWNITKEEWLSDVAWLNNLSLKASYGTTGNSSISNYLAYGVVGAYKNLYAGGTAWGLGNPSND
ncbi:MAG TPA: SusC/RagA family TonB-linked outer membrane protein, partial [Rikenellaceae bacterium]|nr:SusC/RagA family TonB-linked outer membrane protein [Rikenellaceae bacterium]